MNRSVFLTKKNALEIKQENFRQELSQLYKEQRSLTNEYILKNNILSQTKWFLKDGDDLRCENIEVIWEALGMSSGDGKLLHLYDDENNEFQIQLSAKCHVYCYTGDFIKFLKKHNAKIVIDSTDVKEKIQELQDILKALEDGNQIY